MLQHLLSSPHLDRFTRQQVGAAAFAIMVAAGVAWYALTRKKLTPEELEFQRRTLLAASGRITDGSIVGVDDRTEETSFDGMVEMPPAWEQNEPPRILLYRYSSRGVTYECAQDVSGLADKVRHLRVDLPVQVRYDPNNPADSILVSEQWSGLQHDVLPLEQTDTVEAPLSYPDEGVHKCP